MTVDVAAAILGNQTTVCPYCAREAQLKHQAPFIRDRAGLKIIELECRGVLGIGGCHARWTRIVVWK